MKDWEKALYIFLEDWKKQDCVIGAMVCGSYVTGKPSPHSDIDVHIILSDDVDWRERGNVIVEGYLIEYFANPPKQIVEYFEEDYYDLRPHSMVQFLTGKIIFDDYGEIKRLKEVARTWFNKKHSELSNISIELMKYHLWDILDNLLDCYEQNREDFEFAYYNSLRVLFEEYSRYLRIEVVPFNQVFAYITDPHYKEKYLSNDFPDRFFSERFLQAISEKEKDKKMKLLKELIYYVLDKMGGFNIDGWKIRSSM